MISDEKQVKEEIAFRTMRANMDRATILNAAADVTTGQREKEYGNPERNFQTIATFWNTYMLARFGPDSPMLEAKDVPLMMALLKIARTPNSYVPDNYIDLAGYAAIAGELSAGKR